jgi:hypothetical protein
MVRILMPEVAIARTRSHRREGLWMDDPSMDAQKNNILPRYKLYQWFVY